jgi:branched-chain amino acid transport system substrate-binding protein
LFLCNFGRDLLNSVKQASDFGLKSTTRIVTPQLLYTIRTQAGPEPFEGVIGGATYYWRLEDTVPSARAFNDRYRKAYAGGVPSDFSALGYSGVRTILTAVRNAGTTETLKVAAAMRQSKYDFYKGTQHYRACDHQSVQPVLVIESKSKNMKDKNDIFQIVSIENVDEKHLRSCQELGHRT